jgi:hypothetical protein
MAQVDAAAFTVLNALNPASLNFASAVDTEPLIATLDTGFEGFEHYRRFTTVLALASTLPYLLPQPRLQHFLQPLFLIIDPTANRVVRR